MRLLQNPLMSLRVVYRSKDHFYMDGEEVFNFVMIHVLKLLMQIVKKVKYDK